MRRPCPTYSPVVTRSRERCPYQVSTPCPCERTTSRPKLRPARRRRPGPPALPRLERRSTRRGRGRRETGRAGAEAVAHRCRHGPRDRKRRAGQRPAQRVVGRWSGHAVGAQTGASLELAQRRVERGPKSPSIAPEGKPCQASVNWRAATSQPTAPNVNRRLPYAGRPRRPRASRVLGPTTPSGVSPARCWNRSTAALVAGPRTPSIVPWYTPRAWSATCSAATGGLPMPNAGAAAARKAARTTDSWRIRIV